MFIGTVNYGFIKSDTIKRIDCISFDTAKELKSFFKLDSEFFQNKEDVFFCVWAESNEFPNPIALNIIRGPWNRDNLSRHTKAFTVYINAISTENPELLWSAEEEIVGSYSYATAY